MMKAFEVFKIQGFQTPEEMFLVGYIMAHGGEQYILEIMGHNLDLLMKCKEYKDMEFWLPHIKDDHNIHVKVSKEDVEEAKRLLREQLEKRKASIPEWVQ